MTLQGCNDAIAAPSPGGCVVVGGAGRGGWAVFRGLPKPA